MMALGESMMHMVWDLIPIPCTKMMDVAFVGISKLQLKDGVQTTNMADDPLDILDVPVSIRSDERESYLLSEHDPIAESGNKSVLLYANLETDEKAQLREIISKHKVAVGKRMADGRNVCANTFEREDALAKDGLSNLNSTKVAVARSEVMMAKKGDIHHLTLVDFGSCRANDLK